MRHRGFGFVRRLPSKRWQASEVGPDLARHLAPSTYASKGDAEAWLGAERSRISAGSWASPASRRPDSPAVTFEAFAAEWVANRPLKPRTREGYGHRLRGYLIPAFGPSPMTTVSPSVVRRWWLGRTRRPDDRCARLRAAAGDLLDGGGGGGGRQQSLLDPGGEHLASSRRDPPGHRRRARDHRGRAPGEQAGRCLLCAWCALRIGEALELRRGDLDLPRGQLTIGRAVSWLEDGPVVGTPKSRAGMRTVAIPPHITAALARHLAELVGPEKEALLFTAREATSHLQPSVFQGAWRKARAAAGREDLRVHDSGTPARRWRR